MKPGICLQLYVAVLLIAQMKTRGKSQCRCDLSSVRTLEVRIERLTAQLQGFQERIDSLSEKVGDLQQVESGWRAPGNGYQYYVTTTTQTWQESRRICQAKDGDLATAGVRNSETRDILWNTLLSGRITWIGLNDIEEEGNWVWVDGETYNPRSIRWHPNQPDNWQENEDCGEITLSGYPSYGINDDNCQTPYAALCEKRL